MQKLIQDTIYMVQEKPYKECLIPLILNTMDKVPEVVDKFNKSFEEHIDRNRERRIK